MLENERHVDETGAPGSSGSKTTRLWKSEGWEVYLIASNSLHDQAEKPHPRLYGTFPHVLARISHVLVNRAKAAESGALMGTEKAK